VGTLRSLGAIKLAADGEETATIKYVSRFTFDRDGNIYFLGRRPDEPMTLAGVDQNGRLLSKRPFTTLNTNTSWWPSWNDLPRIKDNHFVMMRKTSEGTDDWLAFLVDLTNGEEEPYSAFPRGVFGSVARFPDGSLVVVTRFDVHPTDTDDQVALYDATGQKVWRVRSVEQPDGDWKWSTIREVTVTRRDEIALLASNTVYILDRQGKLIRKIDLTGAFGRTEFGGRTGYLSDIVADAEGGFVLWDFGNPPVVLRYSSDGTVRSRWSPRHPDGRTFTIRPGVQVAPDGRLWTSDGSSFMRLTDDGVVDLVLGDAPASTAIEGVAGLTVGSDGTIYVVSKPTGGIHVFDSGGGLLRIDAPDPTDFPGTVETAFIAVTDRGDYYVQRPATKVHTPPDEYLHFSPEGDRIGFMTFEPRFSDGQWGPNWCFQPETGYRCGLSGPHDTLTMVDPPNTLIREIRKRPNGKWFSRVSALAIAPDGTMATLNSELGAEPALFEVDLWTEAGDPVRTIQLPTPKKNFTGLAYDGKRIVVAGNEEVLIISPDGSIIERWALSETGAAKGRWQAYILPGGRKLLLHETAWNFKAPVIHRFELP